MMEKSAIICLQRWWRKLISKTKIVSLRLLEPRASFEEFASLLTSKDTISVMRDFLKAHKLPFVSPRLYLSAFMLFHWGSEITGVDVSMESDGTSQTDIVMEVYEESKRLVRLFSLLVQPLMGSPRCLKGKDASSGDWDLELEKKSVNDVTHVIAVRKFTKIFNVWKAIDKKSILDHMCYNYSELSNCKNMIDMDENSEYKEQILKYVKDQQTKIRRHIEELAGKDEFDKVMASYRPVKLSCTYNQMREIMQKAFWDKITEDLSKSPPDHKHVLVLFDDVKTSIRSFIPRRADLHTEMDTAVDIDFINQMIVNNVFDHKDLLQVLEYLVKMIRKLEPPIEDKDTDEWLEQVTLDCQYKKPWKDIIPKFFKKMFSKIEGIRDSLAVLQDASTGTNE